jgi:hypothetical protein
MANEDNPVSSFWSEFCDTTRYVDVACEFSTEGSLATKVLTSFGIPCTSTIGGTLDNIDIKQMDAIQVLKMSLLEASAISDPAVIYEPVMGSDGVVDFKAVGRGATNSFIDEVYYDIQTGTYTEACTGVMIIGGKPLTVRKSLNWLPIWGTEGQYEIYETGYMFNSCAKGDFNQYATIIYNDPHLVSEYEDGIENLYEITKDNPYDSIIGYAYYLSWPDWATDKEAIITRTDSAKILIKLETNSVGTMNKRPHADAGFNEDPNCYEGMTGDEIDYEDGVLVPLPENFRFASVRGTTVDKFSGISGVYVLGREVSDLRGVPKTPLDADSPTGEFNVMVSLEKNYNEIFTLQVGSHYQVAYDNDKNPYIVFADNTRVTDPIKFPDGGSVDFIIHPDCIYSLDGGTSESHTGVILPTGLTKGILVEEIYVGVELDTPAINIYHPDGWNNRALEIAESLEYLITPLVVVDAPPPIAVNGSEIDQTESKADHDPTTAQDFTDTPLELAHDSMSAGGGMTLTLSFLDLAGCEKLSGAIYNHLNSHTLGATESTYICGPDADPELGEAAPNGIVNSITYSYQDSSAYTISVNGGPMLVGGLLSQLDGGPTMKATEAVSAKGTIIQDLGNHIHFKVHIDGFGDRVALNMVPAVLRVGDIVNVSVHNNPVEA